jgi:hypothetical protein
MLNRAKSVTPFASRRMAQRILAPFKWGVAMTTVGALVVLFAIIGLIDDALPEEEKLKDWI